MNWSYSLHRSMRTCQRRMAFQHIVASATASDPYRREAQILKQLRTLAIWQGSVVHQVLASELPSLLRARRWLNPSQLIETATELARNQFAFSEDRLYRQPGMTKQSGGAAYCALMEHERGEAIEPDKVSAVIDTIKQSILNLASQGDFLRYLYRGSGFIAERSITFRVAGFAARATPDLFFNSQGGAPALVDWKIAASETSDYSPQLRVYGLAVARTLNLSDERISDIELFEVNLLRNEIRREVATPEMLDETEDFVYSSIRELRELVGNGSFDSLDLDELDVAGSPWTCRFCPFSSMCLESLVSPRQGRAIRAEQGSLL